MADLGKIFITVGFFLLLIGFLLSFSDKIPFHLGKLPGDIYIKKENFSFYFPITTSVVLSILLSVVLYLFSKFFR
ncbi:MAG: DUF2905 domain-containing protein [Sulfurospirillum sp.]|nr:MAG: DUF2905 domain-containing protein [Sulfurospirillum sp.]